MQATTENTGVDLAATNMRNWLIETPHVWKYNEACSLWSADFYQLISLRWSGVRMSTSYKVTEIQSTCNQVKRATYN